jgi:hypothetical protein
VPSKTQLAYEGALAGDKAAFNSLVWMCIVRCRGIWPPGEICSGADTFKHGARRRRTNRYAWIENWLRQELSTRPRPKKETGYGVVTRCRWRLLNYIEREPDRLNRQVRGPASPFGRRVRRERLITSDEVLDLLSTLDPPQDPILLDLWERLLAAYPDWRLSTNQHLAAVLGVHPNTISSRRAALAALMHRETSDIQAAYLTHGLRLKIGKARKADIHRVESQTGAMDRRELVSVPQFMGTVREMDWFHGRPGEGMPQDSPIYAPLEPTHYIPLPRCPVFYANGQQCHWAAHRCPNHRDKPAI